MSYAEDKEREASRRKLYEANEAEFDKKKALNIKEELTYLEGEFCYIQEELLRYDGVVQEEDGIWYLKFTNDLGKMRGYVIAEYSGTDSTYIRRVKDGIAKFTYYKNRLTNFGFELVRR